MVFNWAVVDVDRMVKIIESTFWQTPSKPFLVLILTISFQIVQNVLISFFTACEHGLLVFRTLLVLFFGSAPIPDP